MKTALYLRVSTTDQTTLNQEIGLKDYCKRNKFEIVDIYRDEGISGAKTKRPELDRMLQDMRKRRFECIMVWRLDRLGRSLSHLLQLIQEFNNKDIRFVTLDLGLDTSTPQGMFFFTISGAFAELEREIITERIKLGLARRKKQGKPLGRQKGSKDKGKRSRKGYFDRWANEKKGKWHSKQTPPIVDGGNQQENAVLKEEKDNTKKGGVYLPNK